MDSKILLLPALLLILSACGGGSGGGEPTPTSSGVDIAITAENAVDVSGSVMYASITGEPVIADNGLVGGVQKAQAATFSKLSTVLPDIPETTESCAVSGSITISGSFASELTVTAGDQFNTDFNTCNNGDGFVLDGIFDVEVTSFSGNLFSGVYSLGSDLIFDDYELRADGLIIEVDGRLSSLETINQSGVTLTDSTDFLTTVTNGREQNLIDYSLTNVVDFETDTYTIDTYGVLDDGDLGGEVSFDTIQTFTGTGFNSPSSGAMIIEGAEGSSIILTALNSVDVMLEVDANGDNVIDETIVTTWDALDESFL